MTSSTVKSSIEALEKSLLELKSVENKLNILHANDIDKASKLIRNLVKDANKEPNKAFTTYL